ncbi:alpha/beta hydrolase [Flavobacterium rhizosphaerae]|uniref:Alpha/beta hydrolase n=1 Tax=Flavobacterium rhizosphaerae TaxID=3163298 RepID=A0ABW8YZ35_9FLAO
MPFSKKRFIKRTLWFLLIFFILNNIIAIFHAYKFTHFDETATTHFTPEGKTTGEKLKFILFGAAMPRPKNTITPQQPYETVYIKSNVKLESWYIKADNPKGTVLLFHGYQADKSSLVPAAEALFKMGYNVLLTDFMGSGGSGGNSTTIGVTEAQEVKDCFEYIKQKGEKKIYLYGNSMGSVAIMRAIDKFGIKPTAIMLACPFGTFYKTVCVRFRLIGIPEFPVAGMLTFWGGVVNGFWAFGNNPEVYAKNITFPTLLMWGKKDNRVSREETDTIFANLNGPKTLKIYPEAGHTGYLETNPDEWIKSVSSFLSHN